MSVVTNVAGSTAVKQGGVLFNIPRELRDEIYRYLVQGIFLAGGQVESKSSHVEGEEYYSEVVAPPRLNLGVLQVSKAISEEAMVVLYSESIFRIHLLFMKDKANLLPPQKAVARMENIELNVGLAIQIGDEGYGPSTGSSSGFKKNMKQIWKATLDRINLTDTTHNTLSIKFRHWTFNIEKELPQWMYRRLKALTRFRTVIVELSPELQHRTIDGARCTGTNKSEGTLKDLESKIQAVKNYLESTWGPAVVGHLHDPGHLYYARTLKFHPQRHMPAILKGRAKVLRAEAHRLELEADRAEVGVRATERL